MADFFVGPVMEKLIDACFDYLKNQVGWQTDMEEELKKLRVIHPQIQAVVSAYSQVEIKDPALNKCLWQLRDAIDEADDVLDEFEYRNLEEQVSKNTRKRKAHLLEGPLEIGKRALKFGKRVLRIDPNLERLEAAVHKLYEISAQVSTFHHLLDSAMQDQQKQQLELQKKRETGSMPTNDLIGRKKEMEFLRQWLREPYQTQIIDTYLYNKISLLSVVGLGGMGKTTLMQHVYEDEVTKLFDVKMWACVSDHFDVETVITNIMKSLKKENINLGSLEVLQRSLQSEVVSKRFLLVLDDIWEADETKWKNVLAPLHYGSSGSKILITTRMNSVASMFAMMIKKSKETLQLNGLEEDECLQLFNTHAFAGVENPDDKLRFIAEKMVNKLSRCPLAAKVIGGILNFNLDESYWTKVLNTNIGNIEPGENDLLSVLKLSYIYLPKYLQNCFAFCCIFPQDHEFDKDDLVQMWIALGFIQSSGIHKETIVDIGGRYFDILVRKSFFDKFSKKNDNKVCYKMHDLLHELAQLVSRQECLRVEKDKMLSIPPPETIRHLSIDFLSDTLNAVAKFKNLRSLFLVISGDFEMNEILEILKASKSIRLLSLCGPFKERTLHEMFGCLIHLRYLKCTFFNHYEFPRSISHLYHLQFIRYRQLKILEMDNIAIRNLPNLSHLIVDTLIIKDPSVLLIMEPLRSISSVRCVEIQKNDELVSFLSEIEQWFLQHSSSISGLKFANLQSLQSLPSSLESISSLKTLKVSRVPQLKLLPNPPSSLSRLELDNLESLQYLPSCLTTSTVQITQVPLLLDLPDLPASLQYLFIKELKSLQCLPSSLSAISSLKTLQLINIPLLKSLPHLPSSLVMLILKNLKSLQCLPSSLSAISSLGYLKLINIPLLKSLPDLPSSLVELGLENLNSLQCLPSSLSAISSLNSLKLIEIPLLKSFPDLPFSLKELTLIALQCLPSSWSALSSISRLQLINIPLLKSLPDLPPSLMNLVLEELVNLDCLPSSLPTISSLESLQLKNIPLLKSLPDLPSSLEQLYIQELESLQCLPSCLSAISSLWLLQLINIPLLKSLPDLPPYLLVLYLENLENLDYLPSCLPTDLYQLDIIKVPRLQKLPDFPASLHDLSIEECHLQLMERYANFKRP